MFPIFAQVMLAAAIAASPSPQSDIAAELRARDQALLDAIAPGNAKLWDEALAPGAVYVDENGEIIQRAEFLKQLQPLPKGVSGTISISEYSATTSGDVATVVHRDDEVENYHGQTLAAKYLMTETWQKQGGVWKLLLVHAYSALKEPPSIALPTRELEQYVGRYEGGPELVYLIKLEGDHLTGTREGRPGSALRVEVRDVLFISGQLRTRKIFLRDEKGRITGFVDRREGNDLVWKKVN
ncbi:MAG TPA: DUF4440 domain-containing protein [Terriglobales bacterium]|nr:DUF4440 domain-containing protein [Terriglobales bacterium]